MDTYMRIKESFNKQQFMHHIGATLETVQEGKVSISVEKNDNLTQQAGFMHAGVTTTIADTAAGYAALSMMPEGYEVLSVEFKINLMRPGAGDHFTATAEVVKPGKQITVVEAEVTDHTSDKIIAKFQGTMIAVPIDE